MQGDRRPPPQPAQQLYETALARVETVIEPDGGPDQWYDQAGRMHRKEVKGDQLVEVMFMHPDDILPSIGEDGEWELPGEQPFSPAEMILAFRAGHGRDTLVARNGVCEAQIQKRADNRYEAVLIRGQTRVSTRHSRPEGFGSPIPAMIWCDQQARAMAPNMLPVGAAIAGK